jgi:two-component system, OmpR family, sensor kinase
MADLLRKNQAAFDEETRSQLLERLSFNAARSMKMIEDLLALARQFSTALADAVTPDPERVILEVVEAAELSGEDVRVDGTWHPVAVAEPDLRSIVRNLVDNASHYGRDESGVLHLRIDAAALDGLLEVVVEDAGPGIPEPDLARVFEPFYRGTESLDRNPSSTGVGLAIVQRAMHRIGGEILLEAAEPRGARFRLRLPRLPTDGDANGRA